VVDGDSDAVTPIATATGDPGRRIAVGYAPAAVTISRSGRTAYVVNTISGTVTPIAVATGRAARALTACASGRATCAASTVAAGARGRAARSRTATGCRAARAS